MITPVHHRRRRRELAALVGDPVLLMGNGGRDRNPSNEYLFRQDSTFLYFSGCETPGAALLIDGEEDTLFAPEPGPDDALWTGHAETIEQLRARLEVDRVLPIDRLEHACVAHACTPLSMAVPDQGTTNIAARISGLDLHYPDRPGPEHLLRPVAFLRSRKEPEEVAELARAANITAEAIRTCMAATRPGLGEAAMGSLFEAYLASQQAHTAFPTIATVRGEVLHNHCRSGTLAPGDLFVLDGGAEVPSGYAADITRTWPVSGRFSPRQRAVYDAVLEANEAAIAGCRSGVRFRAVHETAARVLARFLRGEGLLRCDPDEALETGAHAVFFPHGVGHLIGLDVHDMEGFGDVASYAPGRRRSSQFGTGFLRLDLDLEPGFTVTIEPGIYIVPAILHHPGLCERFADAVDFDRAREWIGFGGVRIEDDVLVTEGDPRVLTSAAPKAPEAVEAVVGSGLSAASRLAPPPRS